MKTSFGLKQTACPPSQPNLIGTLCYPDCPSGQSQSPDDVAICQQSNFDCDQYTDLENDPTNPMICTKNNWTSNPNGTPCALGYTQQNQRCQIRCPLSMTENSDSCIRRMFVRTGVAPICPGGSVWNGIECTSTVSVTTPFWATLSLIVLLSIIALALLSIVGSSRSQTVQPKKLRFEF